MLVTFRELSDLRNSSIIAFIFLIIFFGLAFYDFGSYISILAFAFYLVFNLKWLYGCYIIFARITKLNSSTPKKVVLDNFVPLICFYRPYYNILELINFAKLNTLPAYFNWLSQIISLVYIVIKAFGDQNFDFLYFTASAWVGFSFYLYQGVNSKIKSLAK